MKAETGNSPTGHDPRLPGRGVNRAVGAVLLALACLLALSLLVPGAGIAKRNRPPADLPWFGAGLNSVFVLKDGTWIISRSGYLDRKQRYEFGPGGEFQAFAERGAFNIGLAEDVSGGFSPGARVTRGGSTMGIKPSAEYYTWLSKLRSSGDFDFLNPLEVDGASPPYEVKGEVMPLRLQPGDKPTADEPVYYHDQLLPPPASGLALRLNQRDRLVQFELLPGHWFYDIADDMAYVDPYLYLTTDRQRRLYRLRIDDLHTGLPTVTVAASALTGLTAGVNLRCQLGMDPQRGELFILQPDGRRYWFDPITLERKGEDQLPGVWEQEYAQVSLHPGEFSPYFGLPLGQGGYERLMRGAMLVFLASLLGLSLLWRPRWKSTLAATTADSNSSEPSGSTSPDSDTA